MISLIDLVDKISLQEEVSEMWYVENTLKRTVHIASVTNVLESILATG